MSEYFAGIDGGQSSTIAVVGDASGRIVGRGLAGGADEVGAGRDSSRLKDALGGALGAAMETARLPAGTPFAAIVAGVSGYEGQVFGEPPRFDAMRFVLMHDAPIAHVGALAGEPGVAIVAGTGSVVYATDGRRGRTTGGWGYLFGDEGSAFWLVREALAELMRREDDADDALVREARAACDFFEQPSLRTLARSLYGGQIGRDRLASFAPQALEMPAFDPITARGAQRLAALAVAAIVKGAHPTLVCIGGMFENAAYRRRVQEGVLQRRGSVRIVEPRFEPAVGALLLAYREAGIPFPPGSG